MTLRNKTLLTTWQEIAFQIVLHILVFLFYAYNRNDNALELNRFVFFLNSAVPLVLLIIFCFQSFFTKRNIPYSS